MSDMQVDRKNTRDEKLKVRVGDVGRQQGVISMTGMGNLSEGHREPH